MTVAVAARSRIAVRRLLARDIRPSEEIIDVLRLDALLEQAKGLLEQAIRDELRRAVRRAVLDRAPVRLKQTPAMTAILVSLHEQGRKEAEDELARLGVAVPRRALASEAEDRIELLLGGKLRLGLAAISVRADLALPGVEAELGDVSADAIARALLRLPGGRDLASRLVSTALYSGMGVTFEQADKTGELEWEYTAVLDAATCPVCRPLDGTRYPSWQAIQRVLPNGGPNPRCLGDGRCRCRAVPVLAEGRAPGPPLPEWAREAGLDQVLRELPADFGQPPQGIDEMLKTGWLQEGLVPGPVARRQLELLDRAGGIIEAEILRRAEQAERTINQKIARLAAETAEKEAAERAAGRRLVARQQQVRIALLRSRGIIVEELSERAIARAEQQLSFADREAHRARWTADHLVIRLREEWERMHSEWRRAADELDAAFGELAAARRAVTREVLSELRALASQGIRRPPGARGGQAARILDEAATWYPEEWVAASNELGWIRARVSSSRGHYQDLDGRNAEILVNRWQSKIRSDDDLLAVAVHELGHRMERVIPRLRVFQWLLWEKRSRGGKWDRPLDAEQPLSRITGNSTYGADELTIPDEWADAYMGKRYGQRIRAAHYEILTTTMQAMVTGTVPLDQEAFRLVLALLALA